MINVAKVQEIDGIWSLAAPILQTCIDRCGDDISTGELWQMCRSGNAFFICDVHEQRMRMASVWQFQRRNGGTVLFCIALGAEPGSFEAWGEDIASLVVKMMDDGGADRLVLEGREWAALFRKLGYAARKLRSTFEVRK